MRIKEKLARIPGGRALTQSISRTKARIKGFLLPTSLFEQMGFTYLGPVDGHDLKSVCELLAQAKKMKKPVLLHVMTQKGRGYAPSENNPEKYPRRIAVRPRDGRISCEEEGGLLGAFRRGAVRPCGQGRAHLCDHGGDAVGHGSDKILHAAPRPLL